MTRWLCVLAAGGVSLSAPADRPEPCSTARSGAEITYLGNEGFLVEVEGVKVLLDALFGEGLEGYPAVPEPIRTRLEGAGEPFDGITLATASHEHGDHFDPEAAARFLSASPASVFLSTRQSAERLAGPAAREGVDPDRIIGLEPPEGEWWERTIGELRVSAFDLHHGRGRPTRNLAVLIEVDGARILHVGDTEATAEDFAVYDLPEQDITVAFVPYWHLLSDAGRRRVREGIAPEQVVAMHLPSADAPASWFGRAEDLEGLVRELARANPGVFIFTEAGATRVVPLSGEGGREGGRR